MPSYIIEGGKKLEIELLKKKIEDSGIKMTALAEKTGILRETLYNRLNENGEFKASEIVALTNVLNLSVEDREKIFLS